MSSTYAKMSMTHGKRARCQKIAYLPETYKRCTYKSESSTIRSFKEIDSKWI